MVDDVATLHLESERLLLRRFRSEDLSTAVEHEQDPRIMRYVREIPSVEASRVRVEGFLAPWRGGDGEWISLAVTKRDDPRMLGMIAFRITLIANQTVEIGYRLHPSAQRQGIGFEACQRLLTWLFRRVGVRKVIAHCVPENVASYRLMEKLGMQREGTLRQFSRLNDEWIDEHVYGLLAHEWRG